MTGIVVSPLNEESVKRHACRAYRRWCDANGFVYDEPSSASGFDDAGDFVLRNSRGELARYKITPRGRVQRVAP